MTYLLYFSIVFLAFATLILLRNRFNFTPLRTAADSSRTFTDQSPRVSICIPARNEEDTIERCVESALNQTYPNVEVLVMDDRSTDRTGPILSALAEHHPYRFRPFRSLPKPDDWMGKSWACHQLAGKANGDILIFIDADTWLARETAARVVRTMGHDVVDFLTVWPRQILKSFWERMLIPLMYYALISLLPVHYVYRAPRWMPPVLRKRFLPYFTAACGQFMAFKRDAYRAIGGHESVKSEVVEDVALARKIRKSGFDMRMYYGSGSVACRMYRSGSDIRSG
ncbi:MAG: glycosyltransferase family 2 protein, partial [Balneolaceae bacterium]|nr:glycosyltransferase family 2 protein [Balneolaceae bacterium]